ncbi:endonuclease/exonuclease/phosphatase family protein [Jannaschia sp. W003]|uniref:endonuclease/exonuclease/phosphatase family protein n=1 Tax=Jannaschia sp. W003 TaxID=2867012 RepID=UPI0021A65609|nr:endonuclease/exonuclease/phosphatase family protein [Jannaschia sp. W003]UWQ21134.1 endonuclease/exonuclease/phosphatase family protein [Jannaschia sp. W003]
MLRKVLAGLAAVLALAALAVTLLPLSHSAAWWVRMWDFPRYHIALAALVALLLSLLLPRGARGVSVLAMLGVLGWQGWWIWPHTPLGAEEVALVEGQGVRAVSLNLLQENRDHGAVLDYLERHDPDLVLLMETDAVWAEALEPFLARYPHRAERIADDYYGMILATRLPADRIEMAYLSDDVTPAGVAELSHEGRPFTFVGLHPRPPVPDTDTDERDEQIAKAALLARRDGVPTVAMGDFNDVSWSRTGQRFRELGGYHDPRAGRGILASFSAESRMMRFPIDHGLVTDGIALHGFRIGPEVGSDHFPVEMRFSVGRGN